MQSNSSPSKDLRGKRLLLTSGTDFLGARIGREVVRRGGKVVIVSRDTEATQLAVTFPAEVCPIKTLTMPSTTEEFLSSVDAVLTLWDAPADQVDNCLAALSHNSSATSPAQRWIGVSQSAGMPKGSVIGETKSTGEQPCRTHVSSGLILSMDGGELPKIVRQRNSRLLPRGLPTFDGRWCHIDDLTEALLILLFGQPAPKYIHLGSPEQCGLQQFVRTVDKVLGHPAIAHGRHHPVQLLGHRLGDASAHRLETSPSEWSDRPPGRFNQLTGAITDLLRDRQARGADYLIRRQWLPIKPFQMWEFFRDEANLEAITPPWLKFEVLGKDSERITENTHIDYRLVLHKIPIRWRTRIILWQPPTRFIDRQIRGPYELWHHLHAFEPLGDGTLMTDRVQYKMPLYPLGGLLAGWKVHRDVEKIFGYRQSKVVDLYQSGFFGDS